MSHLRFLFLCHIALLLKPYLLKSSLQPMHLSGHFCIVLGATWCCFFGLNCTTYPNWLKYSVDVLTVSSIILLLKAFMLPNNVMNMKMLEKLKSCPDTLSHCLEFGYVLLCLPGFLLTYIAFPEYAINFIKLEFWSNIISYLTFNRHWLKSLWSLFFK